MADDVLKLALTVAQQVMRQALAVHPELIVPVVQDALSRLIPANAQPVLTLHPDDAALVREYLGEQLAADSCRVAEDSTVRRGGCTLHTPASQIDASVESRWQRVTAALGQEIAWIK